MSTWYSESSEMPTFIEPQLKSLIHKLTSIIQITQQTTYQTMPTTLRNEMLPAYIACRFIEPGNGVFNRFQMIIEDHVRDHRNDMLKNLNTTTKKKLTEVITRITKDVKLICSQLIKDIDSLYQSHVDKSNTLKENEQKNEICQKLRDVIKNLLILDGHQTFGADLNELQRRLTRTQSGLSSLEEDESPSPKRPKLDGMPE